MSPEAQKGIISSSGKSDIYSIGITTLQLMYGYEAGKAIIADYTQNTSLDAEVKFDLCKKQIYRPRMLKELVIGMLSKEHKNRMSCGEILNKLNLELLNEDLYNPNESNAPFDSLIHNAKFRLSELFEKVEVKNFKLYIAHKD